MTFAVKRKRILPSISWTGHIKVKNNEKNKFMFCWMLRVDISVAPVLLDYLSNWNKMSFFVILRWFACCVKEYDHNIIVWGSAGTQWEMFSSLWRMICCCKLTLWCIVLCRMEAQMVSCWLKTPSWSMLDATPAPLRPLLTTLPSRPNWSSGVSAAIRPAYSHLCVMSHF